MAVGMENISTSWLDEDVPILWRLNIICNASLDVVITSFVALRCYAVLSSRVRLQLEDCMFGVCSPKPSLFSSPAVS